MRGLGLTGPGPQITYLQPAGGEGAETFTATCRVNVTAGQPIDSARTLRLPSPGLLFREHDSHHPLTNRRIQARVGWNWERSQPQFVTVGPGFGMTLTLLFASGYSLPSVVGIRVFDVSHPDGPPTELSAVAGVENPSFLALHPNKPVLYAVSETAHFEGRSGGGLVAFRIDRSGSLTPLGAVSSHGNGPCHVAVHPSGGHISVANYRSGSIAIHALCEDGSPGALVAHHQHSGSGPSARQEGPHPHCVRPAPDGESVYAVDLGTDEVIRYDHVDRPDGATFVPGAHTSVATGAGPRHIAFHPWHPLAVLVNELDNTVTSFRHDEDGRLVPVATLPTLPSDAPDDSLAADIQFHPAGHRCYVSNRGHDSIAVFDCDDPGRALISLGHVASGGRTPRSLAVHPSGRAVYVANQDSDRITAFSVDPATGHPERVAHEQEMPSPTCVITMEVPS